MTEGEKCCRFLRIVCAFQKFSGPIKGLEAVDVLEPNEVHKLHELVERIAGRLQSPAFNDFPECKTSGVAMMRELNRELGIGA